MNKINEPNKIYIICMKLDYKYTIIYTLFCLFLFWSVIKYGVKVHECFSSNSPLYSHTVNLPITDPVDCKNFCGPNAKCLITNEQCTSDIDCYGCTPSSKPNIENPPMPYDAAGKLGQNQGLQYSPLTTGYDKHSADFAQIFMLG